MVRAPVQWRHCAGPVRVPEVIGHNGGGVVAACAKMAVDPNCSRAVTAGNDLMMVSKACSSWVLMGFPMGPVAMLSWASLMMAAAACAPS